MVIPFLSILFAHGTHIPVQPWTPSVGAPDIVLCNNGLQPYPTARFMEAINRWRSWGAKFASVTAKPCDYEIGPLVGESWLDITDETYCKESGCLLGLTRVLSDEHHDILATMTLILASPAVYDAGVVEHELGHALGLDHPCELNQGFSTLPEGFHYCKDGEAAGHLMSPDNVSTDPWIIDGVKEALRK